MGGHELLYTGLIGEQVLTTDKNPVRVRAREGDGLPLWLCRRKEEERERQRDLAHPSSAPQQVKLGAICAKTETCDLVQL